MPAAVAGSAASVERTDDGAGAFLAEDKENRHNQGPAAGSSGAAGKPAVAKRRSLGASKLKTADLYDACIRLANENKINAKNSWDLKLIDHMDAFMGDNDKEVNFQKASCTLDATVKIYSCRVDSVHNEAFKVLSSLSLAKNPDQAGREKEDGGEGEDAEGGSSGASHKRSATRPEDTLESGEDALRGGERDSAFAVDPLFRKMAASFDEGGAKGMLLNALPIGSIGGDVCRVVFDSSDVMGGGGAGPEEGAAGEKKPPPAAAAGSIDISDLAELFAGFAGRLDGLEICADFAQFRGAKEEEVLALEARRAGGAAAAEAPRDEFEVDEEEEEEEAPRPKRRTSVRRSRVSLGVHIPDAQEDEDEDEDAGGAAGGEGAPEADMAMDFGFGGDGPPPEDLAPPSPGAQGPLEASLEPPAEDGGDEGDEGGALAYGEAGAAGRAPEAPSFAHWKFRNRAAAAAAKAGEAGGAEGAAAKRKRRARGEFRPLRLTAVSLKRHAAKAVAEPKKRAARGAPMPEGSITATSVTLLARPTSPWPIRRRVARAASGRRARSPRPGLGRRGWCCTPRVRRGAGGEAGGAADDDGVYCEIDDDYEDAASLAPRGPEGEAPGAEAGKDGIEVVPVPRKVGRIAIGFARVAKRVDVRALKEHMWRGIATAEARGAESLQGLCQSVPARMRPDQAAQVSISFFFICLLHLANEKCLALRGAGDLGDIAIALDAPSGPAAAPAAAAE
eukprot:tig00021462_g21606.t1